MLPTRRRLGRLSSLFALSALPACVPPSAPGEPVEVVEILGLVEWTPERVAAAVAQYAPGVTLADAACAVVLREQVGFANAAAMKLSFQGVDTTWVVLSVVEPSLRHLVRPREYRGEQPRPQRWRDMFAILDASPNSPHDLQHPQVLIDGADAVFGSPIPQSTIALRAAMRDHDTEADFRLAAATLLDDANPQNRAVAALVLSNFADRDEAYYLLLEGLRGFDHGTTMSSLVLSALSRSRRVRRVEWRGARDALDALMGGTNLFAYGKLLEVLVATEIDARLGKDLTRLNPALLLDHLAARNPSSPRAARAYLTHVAGVDLGADPEDWREWIEAG